MASLTQQHNITVIVGGASQVERAFVSQQLELCIQIIIIIRSEDDTEENSFMSFIIIFFLSFSEWKTFA